MNRTFIALCMFLTASAATSTAATIAFSCAGNCGTASANGFVTTPPSSGGTYSWVSTVAGVSLGGVLPSGAIGDETNGSTLTSAVFTSDVGQVLQFSFNYVTSDEGDFMDYAWAALMNAGTGTLNAYLFTARTKPVGSISPGSGMPPNTATLAPASVSIFPASVSIFPASVSIFPGTEWAQLGDDSGACFAAGCGHSGWVNAQYEMPDAGDYYLAFGVSNWIDANVNSGMAIDGVNIDGVEVEMPGVVPEPGTIALLFVGLAAVAICRRSAVVPTSHRKNPPPPLSRASDGPGLS